MAAVRDALLAVVVIVVLGVVVAAFAVGLVGAAREQWLRARTGSRCPYCGHALNIVENSWGWPVGYFPVCSGCGRVHQMQPSAGMP